MHSEADPLRAHPQRLVDLEQQHRHQRRLPVVAVDDLRALAGLEHELQRRLAEERKPVDIVGRPVQLAAAKERIAAVRLDEEALAASTNPNNTLQWTSAAVPRHP